MDPGTFGPNAPGKLFAAKGLRLNEEYWAFVPDPLPPRLTMDLKLLKRQSEADQALGELNGIWRMLPRDHLLIRPFVRREAVSSSRIEGTITDLRQLLLFEADPNRADPEAEDRREVHNYVTALEYGLGRLQTLPVCLRLFRELHEHLMKGVRGEDKRPGEFRDRQNMIGKAGQSPREARFVPPPVRDRHMQNSLDDLERFIGSPGDYPILIQLALIHYQFETIHPFLDGNGRIGRLLLSLLLCERGCLDQPWLYLSEYFEANRDAYVDHLLAVSQRGAWATWIEFFLEGVASQSRAAIQHCRQLLGLRERFIEQARGLSQSASLLRIIDILFDRPAFSVPWLADELGVTFRAAQLNVAKLEQAGILTEVTGRERNRIYGCLDIIDLLS